LTILTIPATSIRTSSLEEARDQLIADIRYTQTTALLNSKFYSLPEDGTELEERKAKFWFKGHWQIFISYAKESQELFYTIYSDSATDGSTTSFDRDSEDNSKERAEKEILINHFTKEHSIGQSEKLDNIVSMNLTNYGVRAVIVERDSSQSGYYISKNPECKVNKMTNYSLADSYHLRLIFDSFGRPYCNYNKLDEGSYHPFSYIYYGNSKNALIHNSFIVKLVGDSDEVCFRVEGFTGYTYPSECW
jgi:hypothetical protein